MWPPQQRQAQATGRGPDPSEAVTVMMKPVQEQGDLRLRSYQRARCLPDEVVGRGLSPLLADSPTRRLTCEEAERVTRCANRPSKQQVLAGPHPWLSLLCERERDTRSSAQHPAPSCVPGASSVIW